MAKTYDYIITLKSSKNYKTFDWITQLLLFIAITILSYNLYRDSYNSMSILVGIVFILMIVSGWIYSRVTRSSYRFSLLWSGVCFLCLMKSWLGVAYIILALIEKQIKFKQEIGVDAEGVTFNSFPTKKYSWQELSNVILKDGLITVDLQNNKLFQKELNNDTTPAMEKEFNDFCRSRLNFFAIKS